MPSDLQAISLRLEVVQIRRGENELEAAVVEKQRNPLLVVCELRDDHMRDLADRLLTIQRQYGCGSLAASEEVARHRTDVVDFHMGEEPEHDVEVMNHAGGHEIRVGANGHSHLPSCPMAFETWAASRALLSAINSAGTSEKRWNP